MVPEPEPETEPPLSVLDELLRAHARPAAAHRAPAFETESPQPQGPPVAALPGSPPEATPGHWSPLGSFASPPEPGLGVIAGETGTPRLRDRDDRPADPSPPPAATEGPGVGLETRGMALPRFLPGSGFDGPGGSTAGLAWNVEPRIPSSGSGLDSAAADDLARTGQLVFSGEQARFGLETMDDAEAARLHQAAAGGALVPIGANGEVWADVEQAWDDDPASEPFAEPDEAPARRGPSRRRAGARAFVQPADPDESQPIGWPDQVYWRVAYQRVGARRRRVYIPVTPPMAAVQRRGGYRAPRIRSYRWARVLVSFTVFVLIVGGAGLWVRNWWLRQLDPSGPPGAAVTVLVPEGASTSDIVRLLKENEVIDNEWAFRFYLDRKGIDEIQAGEYSIAQNSAAWDVVKALESPVKPAEIPVDKLVIPEGLTLVEIADRVAALPGGRSAEAFLELAENGKVRSVFQPGLVATVEGLVYPATYDIPPEWSEFDILTRMVEEFDERASALGLAPGVPVRGLDPYQIIVIASLIEEEAKVADDRALISQVIHNRLAAPMRLQIDATVLYARELQGLPRTERMSNDDLLLPSPWNTYTEDGLPPTPIAASRSASIEAAMNPIPGPYLFYVLTNVDGSHSFAATLEEFEAFKAQAKADGVI